MAGNVETIGVEFDTSGLLKGRKALDDTAKAANKAADAADDLSDSNKRVDSSSSAAARGVGALGAALSALGLSAAAIQAIKLADAYAMMQARLSLVTGGTAELAKVSQQLFDLAQRTRTDLGATVDLYTALARSTKDLGLSQQQLLKVTETFNKAIIVSGASTQAAQAAIAQFNQAMSSGVLRGEEFNAISEQAPRIMDLLASSLGKTRGELRQMAQDGQLTADVVLPAIMAGAEQVNAEFERMPVTVGQAMQMANNSLLSLVGSFDQATGATALLSQAAQEASAIMDAMSASIRASSDGANDASGMMQVLSGALKTLALTAATIGAVFEQVAKRVSGFAAVIRELQEMDFQGALNVFEAVKEDLRKSEEDFLKLSEAIFNADSSLKKASESAGAMGTAVKTLNVMNTEFLSKSQKKRQELDALQVSYLKATNNLQNKNAVTKMEAGYLEQVAAVEKKYAGSKTSSTKAINEQIKAMEILEDIEKKHAKIEEKRIEEAKKLVEGYERQAKALMDKAKAAEFELETYGLTESARYTYLASLKQEEVALATREMKSPGIIKALQAEASAYTRLAKAARGMEDIGNDNTTRDAAKSVAKESEKEWAKTADKVKATFQDTFRGLVTDGGNAWEALGDSLEATLIDSISSAFYDGYVKKAVDSLVQYLGKAFGDGGGGWGGIVKDIAGMFTGGGSGGGGFDFTSASSWISAGKSLWSGFSSLFGTSSAVPAMAEMGAGGSTIAAGGSSGGLGGLSAAWPLAVIAGMFMSSKAYDEGFRNQQSGWGNGAGGAALKGITDVFTLQPLLEKIVGGKVASILTGTSLAQKILAPLMGEQRGGGQYALAVDGQAFNARRGNSVAGSGVTFLEGPGGGQLAGDQVKQAITSTIGSINNVLKALGSSATVVGFQAGLETSDKGRGGVFSGGRLSTGATFGESGAGDNYAGTLFERTSSQSGNAQEILQNFSTDLMQVTVQALQAATDIPKTITGMLKGVDAEALTDEAAQKLLDSITQQIVMVEAFSAAMDLMPFENLKNLSFDATSQLFELAGGLENLSSKLNTYYQNFYTAEEQAALATENLTASMRALGYDTLPTSREQFRALMEAIDTSTEAGQKQFVALLGLSDAFAELVPATQAATEAAKEAAAVAQQRAGLETQLLTIQGKTKELRARELAALDPTNRAIQELIWNLQDQAAATQAAAQAAASQRSMLDKFDPEGAAIRASAEISSVFAAFGASDKIPKTKAELANLIGMISTSTELGQKQIAALSGLASSFDTVFAAQQAAADEVAQAAERARRGMEEQARLEAQIDQASAQAANQARDAAIRAAEEQRRAFESVHKSISDALRSMMGQSEEFAAMQRQQAKATLQSALAIAKAGGSLVGFKGLDEALSTIQQIDMGKFGSYLDYAREYGQSVGLLSELEKYTRPVGSHAMGLDEVPYDGYVAQLHKGERVQTASAAKSSDATAAEVRSLRSEIKAMLVPMVDNGNRVRRRIEQWDGEGLPETRDVA